MGFMFSVFFSSKIVIYHFFRKEKMNTNRCLRIVPCVGWKTYSISVVETAVNYNNNYCKFSPVRAKIVPVSLGLHSVDSNQIHGLLPVVLIKAHWFYNALMFETMSFIAVASIPDLTRENKKPKNIYICNEMIAITENWEFGKFP